MQAIKLTLTVALLATLCVGCNSGGNRPPTVDLQGTNWQLVGLGGQPPAPASKITLTFEGGGKASGSAGVNNYFGDYETSSMPGGGTLAFGEFGSTRMSGPQELMDQEQKYLEILRKITGYRADSTLLELAIGNSPVLRYRKVRTQQ